MTTNLDINTISMNQNRSLFAIGMNEQYYIYRIHNDPHKAQFHCINKEFGDIYKIKILNRSNIIAYVKKEEKQILFIWDASTEKIVKTVTCDNDIIHFDFTEEYIVIACLKTTYVFSFEQGEFIKEYETCPNPYGIFSLFQHKLITKSTKEGYIALHYINRQSTQIEIKAHETDIICIQLNQQGNMVATSSNTGTLIQVFSIHLDQLESIKTLRRGLSTTHILSIHFSDDGKWLLLISDTSTVHIFYIYSEFKTNKQGTYLSYFNNYVGLPSLNNILYAENSLYKIQTDTYTGKHIICSFQDDMITLINNKGLFTQYTFKPPSILLRFQCTLPLP